MAQKLHSQYGFSYDKLKVLLGGWHAWQDAGYPAVTATPGAAAPAGTPAPQAPAGTPIPLNPGGPTKITPAP